MKTDWEVKTLSQVCDKITDGTHQTPTYFQDGIIFLSSKNVTSGKIDWANIKYIDTKQHLEMHKRVAPRVNDILLAKNGTTGVAAIVDKDEVFDIYVSLALLRVKGEVLPSFMLYFINSPLAKAQFNKRLKGMGVPNLHLEEIRDVLISYPKSLPEQQRIVAILDEALAAIDKAKANAEKNLQNARELFESYLQSVFANPGEGWEEKTLGEVCENIMTGPFGSMLHKKDYVDDGIPIVNPQNIINGQILPLRKTMINEATFKRLEKYALKNDDIVIARRGEMGRCAVVKIENVGWLCGTGSFVVRVNRKKVSSAFLNMILGSSKTKEQLTISSIGATMSNLNQSILSELSLKIPPLSEQKTIIDKLDALSVETKKLEAIYRQKLTDLDELKKAILQKAFQGELTSTSANALAV